MKLCYAAALALVGWYLIFAPVSQKPGMTDKFVIDRTAPLSHWVKSDIIWFDCLSDCQRSADWYRSFSTKHFDPAKEDHANVAIAAMTTGICIPMDDPRLKGN